MPKDEELTRTEPSHSREVPTDPGAPPEAALQLSLQQLDDVPPLDARLRAANAMREASPPPTEVADRTLVDVASRDEPAQVDPPVDEPQDIAPSLSPARKQFAIIGVATFAAVCIAVSVLGAQRFRSSQNETPATSITLPVRATVEATVPSGEASGKTQLASPSVAAPTGSMPSVSATPSAVTAHPSPSSSPRHERTAPPATTAPSPPAPAMSIPVATSAATVPSSRPAVAPKPAPTSKFNDQLMEDQK